MIVEHAILDVVPGQEAEFQRTFAAATAIITSMSGFQTLSLQRCVENRSRYLLLVEWRRLEDHTEGFRRSAQYEGWKEMLHHFYDPFPIVEHFESVIRI
jgi:heme-degrading monooxygenase HmoA